MKRDRILLSVIVISLVGYVTGCSHAASSQNTTGSVGSGSSNSTVITKSEMNVAAKGVSPNISKQAVQKAQSTVNELSNEINQLK